MLTDAQVTFLVELLGQFKLACPHYGDETDAQKVMVDEIIAALSKGPFTYGEGHVV